MKTKNALPLPLSVTGDTLTKKCRLVYNEDCLIVHGIKTLFVPFARVAGDGGTIVSILPIDHHVYLCVTIFTTLTTSI